jgi:hypothetical protein
MQRYQVSPAVVVKAADRLVATSQKIIREPGTPAEKGGYINLAKVHQSLAEVE